MIGELIGGVVSAAGMILGKTFINKLSSNKESSITPAMPTVVEKDDRYQKLLQQYVIQQEKREAKLKQLVFASTKMQGQAILQEEKWRELTYQQQQVLIDNAAKKDNKILELKEQELQQIQELEHLKLTLMEQWHQEKFSLQNRQILQEWDLSNWNSKLNREETEDLLQSKTFQNRLLVLVSRPKVTGNPLFSDEILHEQIKNSVFDLNEYIPRSELEVYCDYFKNPIEDTDIPRLKKILNSISTLIISTHIIRNRVHINCVFWGMGEEEVRIKTPSWDLSETLNSSSSQDEAILEVEEMITLIHKLLIVYTKDLYFLNLSFSYQPIILSSYFQDVFQEDTSSFCNSLAEHIEKFKYQQQEQLKAFLRKCNLSECWGYEYESDLEYRDYLSTYSPDPKAYQDYLLTYETDYEYTYVDNGETAATDKKWLLAWEIRTQNRPKPDLVGKDLSGTVLCYVCLCNVKLSEANLSRANLSGANLSGATLYGADLSEANLNRADLRGADLREVNLRLATLYGADLSEANLSGASLRGKNLIGAILREVDLSEADLREADLRKVDLSGADLREADLSGADLRGANLSGANLQGTDFNGANLRGANLD